MRGDGLWWCRSLTMAGASTGKGEGGELLLACRGVFDASTPIFFGRFFSLLLSEIGRGLCVLGKEVFRRVGS